MLVEEIMHRNVHTIEPDASIRMALLRTREYRIRHLPVTEQGRLVGIISDRDLRDALPSVLDGNHDRLPTDILARPVSDMMKTNVITVHPLDFVEDAARILYENNIGCLPVVRGEELAGILTQRDLFHTLIKLFGVDRPSQHFEVDVKDRIGVLAEVSRILSNHKVNIHRVLVLPGHHPDRLSLVFRVQAKDLRGVVRDVEQAGHRIVWPRKDPDVDGGPR